VEAAKLRGRLLDDSGARVGIGQVGLKRQRAASRGAHDGGAFFRLGLRSSVGQGDVGASRSKFARDDQSDAFAASDQGCVIRAIHQADRRRGRKGGTGSV